MKLKSEAKFEGKTGLLLRKWYEEFCKFSPEHLKVSKSKISLDLFVQSRKYITFKFTAELCVMAMKSDTKIQEELTCRFKIDMNFTNFDLSSRKV